MHAGTKYSCAGIATSDPNSCRFVRKSKDARSDIAERRSWSFGWFQLTFCTIILPTATGQAITTNVFWHVLYVVRKYTHKKQSGPNAHEASATDWK